MPSIAFIFVVDGEKYEVMGALLAASIRRHHRAEDVALIAYSPSGQAQAHSDYFQAACEVFSVERRSFDNTPSPWASPYPHGNKILACAAVRDVEYSVFFDTDMVLLGALDLDLLTEPSTVSAVPEGVPTWGREEDAWRPVYAQFGHDLPDQRVRLVRGRRIEMLPYFNGGFVGFPEEAAATGQRLPDLWRDTAVEIDHHLNIENKRPWLDQISLPVAAHRGGFDLNVLGDAYNFSAFRRKEPTPDHVKVLHYHIPAHFRSDAGSQAVWSDMVEGLKRAGLEDAATWSDLYRRKRQLVE